VRDSRLPAVLEYYLSFSSNNPDECGLMEEITTASGFHEKERLLKCILRHVSLFSKYQELLARSRIEINIKYITINFPVSFSNNI
jgi:hypothetical protein